MMKVCPVCKTEYGGGEVFCPVDAARLVTPSQMGVAPVDADDPLVGTSFDKYQVIRRIGEGGMGLVFEAMHTVIEKQVAMKVLREDFSKRPEVVERFRQEAKSASRIGHQNIVDISDFGTTPLGQSYFVMEFLEGEDLANVLARDGTVGMERSLHIMIQCCQALGAAHDKGIVHRDMKPENIFLTARGGDPDFVKIVDFGIAKMSDIETPGEPGRKLTKTGMIFGTPEYMSPEQAAGKHLDHRVDIYALGVILFELATGRVPFVGDSFMGILTQHMFEEPPSLREVNPQVKISSELELVITRALSKDPDARYQTMKDLEDALIEAGQGRLTHATLHGYGEPVKTRARPLRMVDPTSATDELAAAKGGRGGLVAAFVILMLVGGAGAAWWFTQRGEASTVATNDPVTPEPATADSPPIEPDDEGETEVNGSGATDEGPAIGADPPTHVPVTIETRPGDGAEVSVDGHEELSCDATPCTIEAPVGENLVFTARLGRSTGTLELEPSEATTVQIALVPQRTRGRRRGMTTTTGTMTTTMRSGDLKIPSIFQE